jgi:CPA1 family monovalent cation:H+ antiporter
MDIPSLVLLLAGLLALVSLIEPFAAQLRVPSSVILAVAGLAIGASSALLSGEPGESGEIAFAIWNLPIHSDVFLFVFLPALLFQGALHIDARDVLQDAVPIFSLAVVAVLVATCAVGFALAPIANAPLLACLLVGAIVATTDPSAVIAVFRDLGAPQRLTRLVEGESLLNDAVAITLFVVFLEWLRAGTETGVGSAALRLVLAPVAGGLVGFVGARLIGVLLSLVDNRLVQVSLSLALPYLVFVAAEHWHLSGPVAVAAAGLTFSAIGPARISPSAWRYLSEVWEQLAFWAGSLVFVLAAILIPKLIDGFEWYDAGLLAALIGASLGARVAMLYGFLPVLTSLKLSPAISPAYRAVIVWGGLRGAVTLALALSVTESVGISDEGKRFVAVLATGFVLFTLLVQGTTLRPLMRLLGLDRLTKVDAALHTEALRWSRAEVAKGIEGAATTFGLAPHIAAAIAAEYADDEAAAANAPTGAARLAAEERARLALAALAAREQDFILEQLESRAISPDLVRPLLLQARLLLEAARAEGTEGYVRQSRELLAFSWRMRLANRAQRRLGIPYFLEEALAIRFEMLLANRFAIKVLSAFANRQIAALYGQSAGEAARAALDARREEVWRSLDALRLQYPEYAEELERRFVRMSALRQEQHGYERLYEEGLIGPEVRRALLQNVASRSRAGKRPRLDLRLDALALARSVPLFEGAAGRREEIARLMRPALGVPGQRLVRKGERGDSAWFIASGAVEVNTGRERMRLGRGDFFGELALLTGKRRQADVTALGYCELLVLRAADFRAFLNANPDIRASVETVARSRLEENRRRRRAEVG